MNYKNAKIIHNYKYDLIIAHRVYPGIVKDAFCFNDKFKMVQLNLRSILNASKSLKILLFVIFDNCPKKYLDFYASEIRKNNNSIKFEYVETNGIGNFATFGKQLAFLSDNLDKSPYLYFSEDDYYYKNNAFLAMIDFMNKNADVHFISPLDHPDRYSHFIAESIKTEIRVNKYCHWRTVGTTCCTFMVRSSVIQKVGKQLSAYAEGAGDGPLWLGITKDVLFNPKHFFLPLFRIFKGEKITSGVDGNLGDFMVLKTWRYHKLNIFKYKKYSLWSPIPSLAIHICNPSISPCCDAILKEIKLTEKNLGKDNN